MRILIGSELTLIESSYWLISFSFFLFLYLSLLKRYNELLILNQNSSNRPYKKNDKDLLLILATCIGLLSILIFSLYLNSDSAKLIYTNQKFLWFVNFILFYWIARILFLVNREIVDDDPFYFIIRDKLTYFILMIISILLLLASGYFI